MWAERPASYKGSIPWRASQPLVSAQDSLSTKTAQIERQININPMICRCCLSLIKFCSTGLGTMNRSVCAHLPCRALA